MTFALIFLGLAITVSMIIVRIGAVVLEMTGLDAETARFQALSAFTGTGFTTREAEDVVRHPQRRRIVSVLILLGSAGIITVLAGVIQALQARVNYQEQWVPLLDIALLLLAVFLVYRVLIWPRLAVRIDRQLAAGLRRSFGLTPARIEELLAGAEGWGIVRFEVPDDCRFVNLTLGESRPRDQGVLILALERGKTTIPSPDRDTKILPGDVLLAYGQVEQMEELFSREGETGVCESPVAETAKGKGEPS